MPTILHYPTNFFFFNIITEKQKNFNFVIFDVNEVCFPQFISSSEFFVGTLESVSLLVPQTYGFCFTTVIDYHI